MLRGPWVVTFDKIIREMSISDRRQHLNIFLKYWRVKSISGQGNNNLKFPIGQWDLGYARRNGPENVKNSWVEDPRRSGVHGGSRSE